MDSLTYFVVSLLIGIMRLQLLLCLLVVSLVSCKKSNSGNGTSDSKLQTAAETSAPPQVQACSLITADEVSAIQKTSISGTQSSQSFDGSYLISLCYYASSEPNKSVSFALTEPDQKHPATSDPRNYWNQTFGRFSSETHSEGAEGENEKEEAKLGRKDEEHEKVAPPKRIEGIGEQAFWAGNRFGGALYVLKKNYILRISVGGPDDEGTKISKSKALAEKAIGHL